MAAVIRQHNSTIINSQPSAPDNAGSTSKCNCRVKANSPMNGEWMVQSVVYRATVRSQDTEKDYTGLTASTFKQRFNSHQHSMRHRKHRHSTALSNYVWSLKIKTSRLTSNRLFWGKRPPTGIPRGDATCALRRNWKLWRRTRTGLWTGDQNLSLNAGMRTSFTSAISLPRFHDSCVPVCISFFI